MDVGDSGQQKGDRNVPGREGLVREGILAKENFDPGLERSFKLAKRSHRFQGLCHNESYEE